MALLCDPAIRARSRVRVATPDALVDLYIDGINRSRRSMPAGHGRRRAHVPRQFQGSLPLGGAATSWSPSGSSGHATSITSCSNTTRRAPAISRRCGSCRRTRAWCSGLISSKTPVLESLDLLKRRVDEATRYIDLDRLGDRPAMRLCQHRCRQPPHRGRPARQVTACSRRGTSSLELAPARRRPSQLHQEMRNRCPLWVKADIAGVRPSPLYPLSSRNR